MAGFERFAPAEAPPQSYERLREQAANDVAEIMSEIEQLPLARQIAFLQARIRELGATESTPEGQSLPRDNSQRFVVEELATACHHLEETQQLREHLRSEAVNQTAEFLRQINHLSIPKQLEAVETKVSELRKEVEKADSHMSLGAELLIEELGDAHVWLETKASYAQVSQTGQTTTMTL